MLFAEKTVGESAVFRAVDAVEVHDLRALEERAIGRGEHFFHDMLHASRKHEVHIRQKLYVRTKLGLYALVGIIEYLLEFIDSNVAPFP